MGQELWLQEKHLSMMNSLGSQFTASSGMEEKLSTGILRGHPFGGISIAWSSSLNNSIKPLSQYKHKHVVGIELNAEPKKIYTSFGSHAIF